MIHHDTIDAKRARNDGRGDAGSFSIVGDHQGKFAVYEGGHFRSSDWGTLDEAMETAQDKADAFDRRAFEDLKSQWRNDPSWNIEDTKGYEDVRQELYAYRLETELATAQNEIRRLHSVMRPFASGVRGLKCASG